MAGADVVVGEMPEGSHLRRSRVIDTAAGPISAAWEYLRANTASVVIDPGASLAELAGDTDVVVLDVDGDLTATQAEIAAAPRGTLPAGGSSHHTVRLHWAEVGMARRSA